jgi:hypothetical protein
VDNVLTPLSNPNNGLIKSQTQFSQYYAPNSSWVGVLNTIDETQLYKVKLTADDSLDFFGVPMHVDSNLIPINVGWNWIGYLPQSGMSPDHGLQSLSPLTGDIIKNQYFFAQYVGGIGWIGNLSYMDAPSGYLFNSSFVDTLHYPKDANTNPLKATSGQAVQNEIKEKMFEEFSLANVSPNQFSGNMNIIGTGILNGTDITDANDKVYAYIDGQIRGVIESLYFGDLDDNIHFLTIYGNNDDNGKQINVMYYDASTGSLHDVNETFIYEENDLIGLVGSKQSLTLGSLVTSDVNEIESLTTNILNVYPNPAKEETVIELLVSKDQTISITIMDQIGKQVAKVDMEVYQGSNMINLNEVMPISSQANGIYNITVLMDDKMHSVKLAVRK